MLSWDLTHKNTQTSTQAHACRVTLTLALYTNTRGRWLRPRIKHTLLHKDINLSDKNIPVNFAKTATAALPFLYLTSKSLNQHGDLLSAHHNLFEEKGEPKRYRTEVLPLTSLTPYRRAKSAHDRGCASGGVYVPCVSHACQVRVTVGDPGLCCCTCVTYFER